MAVIYLTKDNFDKEVLKSGTTVLVDFWAPWCGPCRMLSPVIEELGNEVTDAKICKINVDDEADLATEYAVMTIPTLMIFKNGELINQSAGVKSKQAILDMLK